MIDFDREYEMELRRNKRMKLQIRIISILTVIIFVILVAAMCAIGSKASSRDEVIWLDIYTANGNLSRMLIANAIASCQIACEVEERGSYLDEVEARAKELEKETANEEILQNLFGYVPSDMEISLLLQIAQAESGNTEPITGIERVIEVIANRCRDGRFPNTITGVVTQRNQFETYSNGAWQNTPNERVRKAWDNILQRGSCVDTSVCFFTAGRYNPYCRPAYVIGHHYFGY